MRLRRFARVVAVFLLVVLILAGGLWAWSRMKPSWYDPPDASLPAVQDSAQRIEKHLVEQAHEIRPVGDEWTLHIDESEVNAWLSARLPDWLANRDQEWPESLGIPMVKLDEEAVRVGIDAGDYTGGRVLVASMWPEMTDEGLKLALVGVGVGRVPVPGDPAARLAELAGRVAGDGSGGVAELGQVLEVLTGQALVEPEFELADGRRVQLQRIRLGAGYIELISRTVGRETD